MLYQHFIYEMVSLPSYPYNIPISHALTDGLSIETDTSCPVRSGLRNFLFALHDMVNPEAILCLHSIMEG